MPKPTRREPPARRDYVDTFRNYVSLPFALAGLALFFIAEQMRGGKGNTPLWWI